MLLNADRDAFDREVHRLLADGNDRGLLDRVAELPDVVRALRDDPEERFDVGLPFVNGAALAAVALRRRKRGLLGAALDALTDAYRLGDVTADQPNPDDMTLWDAAAGALMALGATAVSEGDWAAVRSIVVPQPVPGGYYASWLRHVQVAGARTTSDPGDDNVLDVAERSLALHPSFGLKDVDQESRFRALCGFDQLAYLVVADVAGTDHINFYPSYAKHPVAYVEAFVIDLRADGPMRQAIFPGDDLSFRSVLRDVNEMAIYQAAQLRNRPVPWRYEGFQDVRTWAFIREGHRWEDWQGGGWG